LNSVFKKSKQMTPVTNQANWICSAGHTIDGINPSIDKAIMEIQHPEWIGKPCDCRKLIYNEGECFCPSNKHWEIHWEPNTNY
jgi:hypothetical protein